jgi:hypothetical protein
LLTAEAAAAEYRIGGNTAGVDRGTGDGTAGSFVGVDIVGTPLAEREGADKPVGRDAVPSSVAFRCGTDDLFVFVVVGLRSPFPSARSAVPSLEGVSFDAATGLAGVLVDDVVGAIAAISDVSAIDIESCEDCTSSWFIPYASSCSSRSRSS